MLPVKVKLKLFSSLEGDYLLFFVINFFPLLVYYINIARRWDATVFVLNKASQAAEDGY